MKNIIKESQRIILRLGSELDLDFILNAERQQENAMYVGQWRHEQHINALSQSDIIYIVIEDSATSKRLGYAIIAGVDNPNKSIEFKRFVITEKGKGLGRETLKLVKSFVFDELGSHRLWLDVRVKNARAQSLYKSEGFIVEGTLRECVWVDGKYESLMVLSILDSDYNKTLNLIRGNKLFR